MQLNKSFPVFATLAIGLLNFFATPVLAEQNARESLNDSTHENKSFWEINTMAHLEVERYKPLPLNKDYEKSEHKQEQPSQTDQVQMAGLRLGFCKDMDCGKTQLNFDPDVFAIYKMDFAILLGLGEHRSARKNRNQDQKDPKEITFLPADQLYSGVFWSYSNEFHSRVLLGRDSLNNKIHDQITGGHGPLTGLELKFESKDYGNFQFWMHRPELAGSYLDDGGKNDNHSWRDDFVALSKSPRSISQKVSYQIQFAILSLGLHHETQQYNETFLDTIDPYLIDSIYYNGIGLGLQLPENETWRMHFYIAVERSNTELYTLLPTDDKTRKKHSRGHALRSGFEVFYKQRYLFKTSFFLPQSQQKIQGSKPETSRKAGYIGYGNNPLQTRILSGSMDMKPWYQHCSNRDLCDSVEHSHFEPGMRRPSAVLNINLAYIGNKNDLGLTGSLLYPIADSEHSGSNPFSHLKKDPKSYLYREIEFLFRHHFQKTSHLVFKYNRVYRIRPDERPIDSSYIKHSALAAEGLSLQFQIQF